MKVLPQAIAIGNIHSGTIAGKLNGVMPAHTPTGWRTVCVSTAVPTFSEYSPLSSCGMPQANSTTSMPRCTEPIASGSVLPCSCGDQALRSLSGFPAAKPEIAASRARGAESRRRATPGSAAAAACTASSMTSALQ